MSDNPGRVRRALTRLTGSAQVEQSAALERAVRKLAEAQRDQTTTLDARLAGLGEAIERSGRTTEKHVRDVMHAVRALSADFERMLHEHLSHGGPAERQRLDVTRVYRDIDQIAASDAPIIVGPWTGEVGFELMYWIPFVEWARQRWSLAPERQVVVSRGGVASWYGEPRARYADLFTSFAPEAFLEGTDQEERKQRQVTPFDERAIDTISTQLGLRDAQVLHPELMYRLFMPYWRDEAGFQTIESFTRYHPYDPPADPLVSGLPERYVAVRFYFSKCFPDTPVNRGVIQSVIAALASHTPVVLLNPRLKVDDHDDYAPRGSQGAGNRVIVIGEDVPPERNLAVQSAVIARARAFVGTYGGYSYLAPLYGVTAIGFYSERSFKLQHLHLAQRVFERLGPATVMPIDVAHTALVHSALGSLSAPA